MEYLVEDVGVCGLGAGPSDRGLTPVFPGLMRDDDTGSFSLRDPLTVSCCV